MSYFTKVGSFNTTTGTATTNVQITGVGFQPKAILFWWNGSISTGTDEIVAATMHSGFGIATTGSSRYWFDYGDVDGASRAKLSAYQDNDGCVGIWDTSAGAIDGELDFVSFDVDGFTLIIDDQFAKSYEIHYLALGGTDLTNIKSGDKARTTGAGNASFTGLGFKPDALMLFNIQATSWTNHPQAYSTIPTINIGWATATGTNQGTLKGFGSNNAGTMANGSYCNNVEIMASESGNTSRASLVSLDNDGFTLNFPVNGEATVFAYLALKGGQYSVGNLNTRTDGNDIAITLPFQPKAVLLASHNRTKSTSPTDDVDTAGCFGAFTSASERRAIGWYSQNGTANAETAYASEHDECYINISDADAVEGLMDVKSIDASGFTLVMDDTDPSASFVTYLAIGSNPTVPNITGTLSQTLDDLLLSSAGTTITYNTGTFNVTLDQITSASQSTLGILSTTDKVLDNALFSSISTEAIYVNLNKTLDDLSQSILGIIATNANLSKTLDDLTLSSDGTVVTPVSTNSAILDVTLDDISSALNGNADDFINLSKTLDEITFSSAGTVAINSSLFKTLDDLTLSSIGAISIVSNNINTLENISASLLVTNAVSANETNTLDDLTSDLDGTISNNINSDTILDDVSYSSLANTEITCELSSTLDDITSSSEGTIALSISLDAQLEGVSLSSLGIISSNISTNITLEDLILSSIGTVETIVNTNTATLDQTLDDLTALSSATVQMFSTLDKTLDDVVFVTNGTISIFGTLDKTLDDIVFSGVASISKNALLSVTLDDLTVSSNGTVVTIVLPTYTWSNRIMKVPYQNRTYSVLRSNRNQLEQNRTYKVKADKQKVIEYDNVYEVEDE